MGFPQTDKEKLFAACHRRCCVCHRFCGVKIELDHMLPKAEGGSDEIDNAIPVCFECHAEIHTYNDKHPRGTKFRPSELQRHKEQWLRICRESPRELIEAPRNSDVGPLQAMIDELEYNLIVANEFTPEIRGDALAKAGGLFRNDQFARAISEGAVSILNDELKRAILTVYARIGEIQQLTIGSLHLSVKDHTHGGTNTQIVKRLEKLPTQIEATHDLLLSFVKPETE